MWHSWFIRRKSPIVSSPFRLCQRFPLLLDEPDVVRDVSSASFDQCSQCQGADFRMDAPALEIFGPECLENANHLLADLLDQEKFLLGIPFVVGQPCGKYLLVAAEQCRFVLGNHA